LPPTIQIQADRTSERDAPGPAQPDDALVMSDRFSPTALGRAGDAFDDGSQVRIDLRPTAERE
jgi:hypothetical protein